MNVVICGGLRVDYIIRADGQVRLRELGGNAIYAAVGARQWVEQVHLVARVGDNYPDGWLERLTTLGMAVDGVRRLPGDHDMRTFYAYLDDRTRVDRDPERHFARIGQPLPDDLIDYVHSTTEQGRAASPLNLRGSDLSPTLAAADVAHIAPMGLGSQSELVAAFRQGGSRLVTLDPGEYSATGPARRTLREMVAGVDAFLPSEMEVAHLLGPLAPREAAVRFAAWGAPLVVIKRGPAGALLYERDADRLTMISPFPASVVDVTGAGDSFSGAFAVALALTGDPRQAARMGTVAASLTLEGYGALYALNLPPAVARSRLAALGGAAG